MSVIGEELRMSVSLRMKKLVAIVKLGSPKIPQGYPQGIL